MDHNLELIFIRNIIIDALTLPIPALLIIQALHRKNRTPEIVLFFRMCIFDLSLCISYILACVLLLNYEKAPIASVLDFILNFLIGLFPLLLAVHWLLFVEYTLHQSRDIIWRRYRVAMIPFGVGVICTILTSVVPVSDSAPLYIQNVFYILYRIGQLIWLFYILASYYVLYMEKKRKDILQYIRITPTVLPIAVGMIIAFSTPYQIDGLGYAIGLMFADYYMFRRLSFIDSKSGFFNEKYIAMLRREAKKKMIKEATVIRFRTSGDREKLTDLLKFWKPEYSSVIAKNDGEFLVISEVQKKLITERFIFLVSEHAKSKGLEVGSSYETVRI
jgi:hypothetical protein